MRKILCFILVFSLLAQPLLVIPPSVSAQSQNPISYSYDKAGNLLDDGERTIIWDVEGKPTKIVMKETGSQVNFVYDGGGARIAKVVKDVSGNTLSATLYVGGSLERELNPDGSVKQEIKYYPAGSSLAQRKVNRQTGENELIFIHKDHLSSSTLFTDKDGNKKDSLITYYPYGETRQSWDSQQITENRKQITDRLYTGQIKDQETNLYYYNARYYNPKTGLFISADTIGDSLNRYFYAANNPLLFSDPTGHWAVEGAGNIAPPLDAEDELKYTVFGSGYQPPEIGATNIIGGGTTSYPAGIRFPTAEENAAFFNQVMLPATAVVLGVYALAAITPAIVATCSLGLPWCVSTLGRLGYDVLNPNPYDPSALNYVLDVGIGAGGRYLDDIPKKTRYFGLDAEWNLPPGTARVRDLRQLKQNYPGVPAVRGVSQNLPFASETFDEIRLLFVNPDVYEAPAFREFARVLKPGGRVNIRTDLPTASALDIIGAARVYDFELETIRFQSPAEIEALGTFWSQATFEYIKFQQSVFNSLPLLPQIILR